jgi:hypothetical protein
MKTLNKILGMFRRGIEIDGFHFYKEMIESQPDFDEFSQSTEWREFLSYATPSAKKETFINKILGKFGF